MQKNIVPHLFTVSQKERNQAAGHNSFVLWFTGLSGSGKSTIANAVEAALHKKNVRTYVLDGDALREGMNSDLSFSAEDRSENIRRAAETAKILMRAGVVVLASFISPRAKDRALAKKRIGFTNFTEIFINTPVAECERRDTKGLYAKARAGKIENFTGVGAPYEAPICPDVQVNTVETPVAVAVAVILNKIEKKLN
ncbi:MAG: adenylyl-sulfate kinase, partial [Marinirhabdus sp.]